MLDMRHLKIDHGFYPDMLIWQSITSDDGGEVRIALFRSIRTDDDIVEVIQTKGDRVDDEKPLRIESLCDPENLLWQFGEFSLYKSIRDTGSFVIIERSDETGYLSPYLDMSYFDITAKLTLALQRATD